MEIIKVGDKVQSRTVNSGGARSVVGIVEEANEKIVRFRLDEGQSEYGRPIFTRLIHQVTKIKGDV